MSLFQIHKRLIQLGTLTGVAPYHLKNNIFESSTRAIYTLIVIGFLNIIIIYRMISSIITRKNEDDKPFGYTFFLDAISVFTYSSVCFVLAGILFYRVNLISHMNRLLRHPIIQKTYDHEKRTIHHFFLITYGSLILMGVTILSGTTMDRNFQNILDLILSVPLMVLCVMTMVQFLVAIQIIYLSYGRIHFELRTGKLTVEKLRQISFLDIWLKDFAGVVEYAYGPFICVYIFLSFLYMLTIELYIAEGGLMFIKTIYAYFTVMPSIMLFVWFIWKCSLITREAENTLPCLHWIAVDVMDPDIREAIELLSLQLLNQKLYLRACGLFQLDFTLLYSMVGAVTSYVVTLVQFQAAFFSKQ